MLPVTIIEKAATMKLRTQLLPLAQDGPTSEGLLLWVSAHAWIYGFGNAFAHAFVVLHL
jgi:hypothetical protein